ncbi:MAG: hypothetical protein A2X94_16425 [Bdellovibrionales bacterium GWB1_55_8]|nr:MAG: hypothetical protein A2X94_16425 [Bdellovibrionales bacterium GWB1_55_8]
MHLPLDALKHRNYRLYFTGQLLSMVGTWMQSTVQAWLVYRLSGSATWLGIVTFSMQLPAFLASPMAGVVADRVDRRKILLWAEAIGMLQAFALAALVLTGHVELWHVAALSMVLGVVHAFEMTSRHSLAAELVPRTDLHNAIAWNSVTMNGSRIVGPALAGVLIVQVGEAWCFLLNGLSFLAVILGLLLMRLQPRNIEPAMSRPLEQIREGALYVLKNRNILKLVGLTAFIGFFGFPYAVLLPVFAKGILGGDSRTLGFLIGAAGVGAILGAFRGLGKPSESSTDSRQFLLIGVSICTLGLSRSVSLSIAATFFIGFFMMGILPVFNTTIQHLVEDSFRGRVLSIYTMGFLGSMPLGSLLCGWLTDHFGAPAVQVSFGAVFLLLSASLNCKSCMKWVNSRA